MWMAAAAAALAGCATVPPPDPISVEEVVQLSEGGPESPALLEALRSRPLGFPLTYGSLKSLEGKGVPAPVLDTIVTERIRSRARAIAPRYGYGHGYWYPYWGYYHWPYHHGHHRYGW
jgi:hypothetical protein